jgi:dihydroxyacetone kinase
VPVEETLREYICEKYTITYIKTCLLEFHTMQIVNKLSEKPAASIFKIGGGDHGPLRIFGNRLKAERQNQS